jgi:hypothetical protein
MEKGRRYLIPYVLRSGVRHSLLCWDSPQPVARLLPGAAFTAGPSAAPSPSPLAAPAGSSETTWPWLLAGSLVAAGLASLAGLGAARRRARRATPGTG